MGSPVRLTVSTALATALPTALALALHPAIAGTVTGTASFRERIAMPQASAGPLRLRMVAVGGQPPAAGGRPVVPPPLRGTTWRLLVMGDDPPPAPPMGPSVRAVLRLAPDQLRLSGSGGCNRLMGGFILEGEELRFGAIATTRMACDPARMQGERRFLEALARVRRWRIQGNRLELLDGNGRRRLLLVPGGEMAP